MLRSLGSAAQECEDAITDAAGSGSLEIAEDVVCDECDVIENLLGAAFVTCQAEITAIVSHVIRLHEQAKKSSIILTASAPTKPAIMAIGNPLVLQSTLTQIQTIDAFANYFKHNDEWEADWSTLTGPPKRTIDAIIAIGAKQSSTGNLRAGARALGVDDYSEIHILAKSIQQWSIEVRNVYEADLKTHNLL